MTGAISRGLHGRAALPLLRSTKLRLDRTPSGSEEYEDWLIPESLAPTWDPDAARLRIDTIARNLARWWSFFLIYLIIAQGNKDGVRVLIPWTERVVPIVPVFHLEPTEFIAVVTTTTASVFGFLVIVARALFKSQEQPDKPSETKA